MAVIPARIRRLRALGLAGVRQRLEDERRIRGLCSRVVDDITPPSPEAFGAFGERTVVVPPARVNRPDRIFLADDVRIQEHAWLAVLEVVPGVVPKLTIGSGTTIGRYSHIGCIGEIEIGAEVLAAERVFIADTYHGYEDVSKPVIAQPMADPEKVTIGRGSFLGEGAIVLAGVTVGEQAYVAAGAVVTRDVPPRSIAAGNPARIVRRWDDVTGDWLRVDS